MKVSAIRTKTITAGTPEGLDGNIATFVQSLTETQEELKEIQFIAESGFFAAIIIYTV